MTVFAEKERVHSRGADARWGGILLALGLFASGFCPHSALAQTRQTLEAQSALLSPIGFHQIEGWSADNSAEIWPAFILNCDVMRNRNRTWADICKKALQVPAGQHTAVREFFEQNFSAFELYDSNSRRSNTFTGYYEPLLRGSRTRGGPYQVPIYKTPKDLVRLDGLTEFAHLNEPRLRGKKEGGRLTPYPTRAEIEKNNLLAGEELLWVDDAVEAFFLGVQGSGRIELPGGETIRIGYAEQNGYGYRSIGKWLVDQGELKTGEASMQGIKAWVAMNPHRRDELLHQNPSMIFFKELSSLKPHEGPIGSMGIPLTAMRSVAIDPRFVALGTPVFISTRIPNPGTKTAEPLRRLMLAQDTGSAITGAHRADIFFGTGRDAGDIAGRMRVEGSMVVLLPR